MVYWSLLSWTCILAIFCLQMNQDSAQTGERETRANLGLDFWEHQFDDGSLQSNHDKATLFNLAQMRADLSCRTRHFDTVVHSVVPQKWQRSPSKRYVDTASETSSSSDVFPIAPANLPPNTKADLDGDKADKVMIQKLCKKVEDLEHKLSLLTVGMLRDKAKTSEDILWHSSSCWLSSYWGRLTSGPSLYDKIWHLSGSVCELWQLAYTAKHISQLSRRWHWADYCSTSSIFQLLIQRYTLPGGSDSDHLDSSRLARWELRTSFSNACWKVWCFPMYSNPLGRHCIWALRCMARRQTVTMLSFTDCLDSDYCSGLALRISEYPPIPGEDPNDPCCWRVYTITIYHPCKYSMTWIVTCM